MPGAEPATCVFCGSPIGPDEEVSGRAPMAAHASCADAALADDAHWDAINAAAPDEGEPAAQAKASGCLALAAVAALAAPLILLIVL